MLAWEKGFEAVEVRIKGHHHPLTMFGKWITDRHIKVHAASQKEMSKPFQYYYDDPDAENLIEEIPEV